MRAYESCAFTNGALPSNGIPIVRLVLPVFFRYEHLLFTYRAFFYSLASRNMLKFG
jgi:hypothetical protein